MSFRSHRPPPPRLGSIRIGVAVSIFCLAPLFAGIALSATQAAPGSAAAAFEDQVAPLLSRHCLACHNSDAKQGGLDLSRKAAALAGGKSGKALVPGKPAESLAWKHVESGTMPPKDRPRLSETEKRALRAWIEGGAVWSAETIDPTAHLRDRAVASNWIRRLTVPEYVETVRSAVGIDIAEDAQRLLPRDLRADGFSNTAYSLAVDLGHVEAYSRLAQIIAARVDAGAFAARYSPSKELSDANMRRVISGMGKWLLRGPLDERELSGFLRVSTAVAEEGGTFPDAVRYVLEAMLQSPRFIYRVERQDGDGKPRAAGPYELASRLSYALWGAPPDQELMRAADAGELSNRAKVAAQVRRMLQDPRTVTRSSRFIQEWLDLDRLGSLRPNAQRFPTWDASLAADMRQETLAYFDEVVWKQKRPLSALLNTQVAFLTPRLAAHYGLPPSFPEAAKEGLQALYTFEEGSGNTIRDRSGAGEPLDLTIEDPAAVKWQQGQLSIQKSTLIATAAPPKRLIDAVKKSKAITLEAWITPGGASQSGPARILTLSSGPSERNFTLGQEGDRFDVRLRRQGSDANGLPSLGSSPGQAGTRITHVVYTRTASGEATLFVNGEERGTLSQAGELSSWSDNFRLALGNETSKDRPWQGTFHRVAIYSRPLSHGEIQANARAVTRYDLAKVPGRGGLLTQGSLLTVGGDGASMVARGLFVLRDLLHSEVGSAPPGVDTTPVPPKPGLSRRGAAEARLANPACGGCHLRFEPLAFSLEKFDGVGAYHETDEHGNKLREDGSILFPGASKPVPYKTSAEFMDLLAGSDRVRKTLTRKLTQYVLGRPLVQADAPIVEKVHQEAQKGGGTYPSLITAIVMSDLVLMTRTEAAR
ncbi:MAG: DUF1592 domain-containing protein [Armatimonadota bacterium]